MVDILYQITLYLSLIGSLGGVIFLGVRTYLHCIKKVEVKIVVIKE